MTNTPHDTNTPSDTPFTTLGKLSMVAALIATSASIQSNAQANFEKNIVIIAKQRAYAAVQKCITEIPAGATGEDRIKEEAGCNDAYEKTRTAELERIENAASSAQ